MINAALFVRVRPHPRDYPDIYSSGSQSDTGNVKLIEASSDMPNLALRTLSAADRK